MDLSQILQSLFLSGLTILFLGFVLGVWMWLYWLWKTEIRPLMLGYRWQVVKRGVTEDGYKFTEMGWKKENL